MKNLKLIASFNVQVSSRKKRFVTFFTLILFSITVSAQSEDDTLLSASKLKKLSLEELMNIEVTSLSMRPEKLTEVASAIQVITNEDIHRSGVTRLPEALRLAPNLQISQANSHDWAITARGFNGLPAAGGVLANKLLVMTDGRLLYSPLFGGVYWGVQNAMLEDIDRIEVISGPGGTLWGANAVNGVINIISKSSRETQGVYAAAAAGSFLQDFGEVRYGFKVGTNLFCRTYVQRYDQKNTSFTNNTTLKDAWNMTQGGFRMDYYPSKKTTLTFQGDLYMGEENNSTSRALTNGQNVLGRMTHLFFDKSDLKIQLYFDRTWRESPNAAKPSFYELNTYDLDIQQHFLVGKVQSITIGGGYRFRQDRISSGLNPLKRDMPLYSAFIQNEISCIPDVLKLTIGSKFLHNIFSGFEYQPSARLSFTPNKKNTLWLSTSRSVRTPSRFDNDVIVSPVKFNSEKIIAYEMGYRIRPVEQCLLSFATFYNQYRDLRSIDSNSTPPPSFVLANNQRAESWGFEFSGNLQASDWWRIRGGYTYFEKIISATNKKVLPASKEFEGVDPKHQFMLQSIMDISKAFQLDVVGRFVDVVPAASITPSIPSYFTFDVRVAWKIKLFEISIIGQNLAEETHTETGFSKIPRSIYGKIICQF